MKLIYLLLRIRLKREEEKQIRLISISPWNTREHEHGLCIIMEYAPIKRAHGGG